MEVQRLCDVLNNHLKGPVGGGSPRSYMVNQEYSIADMAIFPWFNQLRTGYIHPSGLSDLLSVTPQYEFMGLLFLMLCIFLKKTFYYVFVCMFYLCRGFRS
jgi:hypothetical protein